MKIKIDMKLPSLNEYINACRSNKFQASSMKNEYERKIALFLPNDVKYTTPVEITFTWHESNKKRDLDNISFGKKFIFDALVKKGVLINDNFMYVNGFRDVFMYDTKNTFVEIEIIEIIKRTEDLSNE